MVFSCGCKVGESGIKIVSKEERIVELKHALKPVCFEIEFDYFEFDPDEMSESFLSSWNIFWMRNDQIEDDFYTT